VYLDNSLFTQKFISGTSETVLRKQISQYLFKLSPEYPSENKTYLAEKFYVGRLALDSLVPAW
jgi:hypothetical protein